MRWLRPGAIAAVAALINLAACTPPEPVPSVDQPLPEVVYLPEDEPKAVLIAVHGFNDHKGSFAWFGRYAADRGYAVIAFDQQGFGENANAGRWPGTQTLIQDLRRRASTAKETWPDAPLYVIGESMGAAVAVSSFADDGEVEVDGLILSAPAVWGGEALNPFYRIVLSLSATIAPQAQVTGSDLGKLASDNIEMLRALGRDPLYIRQTKIEAVAGLVELMDRARLAATMLTSDVLMLTGNRDEIVPVAASRSFRQLLQAEECQSVVYENGWHLLLRDLERELVWRDILAWLDDRTVVSGLGQPCGPMFEVAGGRS
ncbi:MAG: alpha/beta hydrolase [Geminicoccaceae bacterium]